MQAAGRGGTLNPLKEMVLDKLRICVVSAFNVASCFHTSIQEVKPSIGSPFQAI
jgi:hypothetical protein